MNNKQLEQLKSYSKLIVYEMHKIVCDEAVFDKLKATLALAEEMECYLLEADKETVINRKENVVPLRIVSNE